MSQVSRIETPKPAVSGHSSAAGLGQPVPATKDLQVKAMLDSDRDDRLSSEVAELRHSSLD